MIDLTQLLDHGERHARNVLVTRQEGSLTPFYHLVTPGDAPDALMPCQFRSDIDKDMIVAAVKQLARDLDAVAAMFIAESWMVTMAPDEYLRREGDMDPPSQDPRRVEVVMMFATDGRQNRSRVLFIKRDKPGGRIVDLETENNPAPGYYQGRMLDGIIPTQH